MAIKIGKLFAANTLVGTGSSDTLIGGLLNDILIGGAGADSLFGGAGFDTADYSKSSAGVRVDLKWGIGWGGDAQGDTLNSIEKVIGSAFDDTFIAADWGGNTFTGGAGKDRFVVTYGDVTITDFRTKVDVIDFQELPVTYQVVNYKGFHWTDVWAQDGTAIGPGWGVASEFPGDLAGYTIGVTTGKMTSQSGDFDVRSLQVGQSAFGPLNVRIEAYDDGVRVGYVEIIAGGLATVDFLHGTASGTTGTPTFNGRFTSIDELWFAPMRDINAPNTNGYGYTFDDIVVLVSEDDKIEVAAGTNIAALAASATSDGQGGTILTHANGSIHLIGVDPATASADWFV